MRHQERQETRKDAIAIKRGELVRPGLGGCVGIKRSGGVKGIFTIGSVSNFHYSLRPPNMSQA